MVLVAQVWLGARGTGDIPVGPYPPSRLRYGNVTLGLVVSRAGPCQRFRSSVTGDFTTKLPCEAGQQLQPLILRLISLASTPLSLQRSPKLQLRNQSQPLEPHCPAALACCCGSSLYSRLPNLRCKSQALLARYRRSSRRSFQRVPTAFRTRISQS